MNDLCFIINSREIYLEKVLVSFNETPMLFVCRAANNIPFAALCTDLEQLSYLIAQTTDRDVSDLVSGKIPMRDIFTNAEYLWSVETSDIIEHDVVRAVKHEELDESVLPLAGALYEIVSNDIELYKSKIEATVFNNSQYESIREHTYSVDSKFELSSDLDSVGEFNKIISQVKIDSCPAFANKSVGLKGFQLDSKNTICVTRCSFDDARQFVTCSIQLRAA